MESPAKKQQKHIRPKVRSNGGSPAAAAVHASGDLDSLLESTRQRIQSRLNVSSNTNQEEMVESQQQQQQQTSHPAAESCATNAYSAPNHRKGGTQTPKSILKQPKYSSNENKTTNEPMITPKTVTDAGFAGLPRAAVKDVVMEREPIAQQHSQQPQAGAIEGYTPKDEPMVVSSISNLMEKAGTLPSKDKDAPQVVEANLSFSCMTPQEYDETLKYSKEMDPSEDADSEAKENVFSGRDYVFPDVDEESENDEAMFSDEESQASEEAAPAPEPRAFMKLWEAITDWVTPEAAVLLKQWRDADDSAVTDTVPPQVDQSDIGSSRRKGLKAMLLMHLSSAINDLGLPQEDQRRMELRLDNLLRTFKYSRPMAKLDSKLWKALTCVLVEMVLVNSSGAAERQAALPDAAKDVGMVLDEYRYLTRSAVTSLVES